MIVPKKNINKINKRAKYHYNISKQEDMIEEYLNEMIDVIIEKKMKEVAYELSLVKPVEREFYSIKEAAFILSITESGLKARGKSGKIELIYDQNNVTIHKNELERYKKKYLYKQMKKGRV